MTPAIQWAQGYDFVYMFVKLALRLDSPACLSCKNEYLEIKENYVNMSFFGIFQHIPVRFNLFLEFENPIVVEESFYEVHSIG